MPDATSLQLKINAFSGKDEYLILCTLRRGVAITCI